LPVLFGEQFRKGREGRAQPAHANPHLVDALVDAGQHGRFVARYVVQRGQADLPQRGIAAQHGVESRWFGMRRRDRSALRPHRRIALPRRQVAGADHDAQLGFAGDSRHLPI
jgi:hypothetical protein